MNELASTVKAIQAMDLCGTRADDAILEYLIKDCDWLRILLHEVLIPQSRCNDLRITPSIKGFNDRKAFAVLRSVRSTLVVGSAPCRVNKIPRATMILACAENLRILGASEFLLLHKICM